MKTQPISRRNFISQGASAAVVAAAALSNVPLSLFAAEDYGGNKIPIGLQLYTVGQDFRQDAAGTLAKLTKLGYKGVEFAGGSYSSSDPKDMRKLLDDNGLKCCGLHVQLNQLTGDNLAKSVAAAKVMGNTRLVVSSLGGNYTKDRASLEAVADEFNQIADKLKADGMRTGFHCHPGEFKKIDDSTVWDIFFSRAKKEVIMQCDLGHMGTGDVDPVMYLNKYPGRAATVHVKPSGKIKRGGLVGDENDNLKWPEIFKACESVGGTEWYIVEYDGGSMEKAEKTIETLRKWGKV